VEAATGHKSLEKLSLGLPFEFFRVENGWEEDIGRALGEMIVNTPTLQELGLHASTWLDLPVLYHVLHALCDSRSAESTLGLS